MLVLLILSFANENERDTFEYVYAKYKNLLYYKAWEILKDAMLAEDAVSEAYMRIYKNLHKIEDPDSNRSAAFMVTIVRNAALTILNRTRSAVTDAYEEDQPDTFDLEQSVVDNMSEQRIYELVNTLDEMSRNIFVLKFAYNLSHREIANQLGQTENFVTVKLHRAKKKLATILEKEGYAHGGR